MKAFKTAFFSWIFPLVPKRLLSRAIGYGMRAPIPGPLRKFMMRAFAKQFKIEADHAEHPAHHYRSFNEFFTRKLKEGLRPIEGPLVHPVDGNLTQKGVVQKGELVQAKGWTYALDEFLADEKLAHLYEGGAYYTYYLCPADYHRVHSPFHGELYSAKHIPGALWPVNEWSVHNVKRLFNLNERVVLNFRAPEGHWSLVLVGATNVGHITVTLDPSVVTNGLRWGRPSVRNYTPTIPVKAGDELGMFHLGSTVICVFQSTCPAFLSTPGGPVRMGQKP